MGAIVNGTSLSDGEISTIRVALVDFMEKMATPGCLGNDEIGESIRNGYRVNAHTVLRLLDAPAPPEPPLPYSEIARLRAEHLRAEQTHVKGLLAELPKDNWISEASLQSRLQALAEEMAELERSRRLALGQPQKEDPS